MPPGLPESSMQMTVTGTPDNIKGYHNWVFCSPPDLRKFMVAGSDYAFALVNDLFVYSIAGHDIIRTGQLALNADHQSDTNVFTGGTVLVSRFIPPEDSNIAFLTLELMLLEEVDEKFCVRTFDLLQQLQVKYADQIFTSGQIVTSEDQQYTFKVRQVAVQGQEMSAIKTGMFTSDSYIGFEILNSSGVKFSRDPSEAAGGNIFEYKELNLQSFGIGGRSNGLVDIFRKAFASRVFPPHVASKLGLKHVKGMLLYGPPSLDMALMAHQIGIVLKGKDIKITNKLEGLNEFVGNIKKKLRDLLSAEAEQDQITQGDNSDLKVIIFNETEANCQSRGSTSDGTGVHDSSVNQLLTKIDAVEALNNVLLIVVTNRKDLFDEALLRPGRLEVQMEISSLDENNHVQILQFHTNMMKENLAPDINLQEPAAQTKNYSGAELEGVVKSTVQQLSLNDFTKTVDKERIEVTMGSLPRWIPKKIVNCDRHVRIRELTLLSVEQIKARGGDPLITVLLEGPSGSGKTAMAAIVGDASEFPYVKIISAEALIGLGESSKCAQIVKVFEDAYKSTPSLIVLDDIESLVEYAAVGSCYSNLICQTLMVLLKRLPPEGERMMVIGTTSQVGFLRDVGICNAFLFTYNVPNLNTEDAKKVLQQISSVSKDDVDAAAEVLNDMPIKRLYVVVEMALKMVAKGKTGGSAKEMKKMHISPFIRCLQEICPLHTSSSQS